MKKQLVSFMVLLSFSISHIAPLAAADPRRASATELMRFDFDMRHLRQQMAQLQAEEQNLLQQQADGEDVAEQLEAVQTRIRNVREHINEIQKKIKEMQNELGM